MSVSVGEGVGICTKLYLPAHFETMPFA